MSEKNTTPVLNAEKYGKVAVLYGGVSAEREISIETGNAVNAALLRKGISARLVDTGNSSLCYLVDEGFDRVFIALHGRGGEDGQIQGALQTLAIPFTGSGVLGSALAMDKIRSKWIWNTHGISTPAFRELCNSEDLGSAADSMQFPVIVKPVTEGSSNGAARVETAAGLEEAWLAARKFDERVMCEEWITGAEYTVGLLQDEILPAIKLETRREFYNYQAKYLDEDTSYICPCGLAADAEQQMGEMSLRAFRLINASGWGRVDIMMSSDGRPWVIEVNTVPGMTSHSLVPMAALQAGIGFDDLVVRILDTSFTSARENHAAAETVL